MLLRKKRGGSLSSLEVVTCLRRNTITSAQAAIIATGSIKQTSDQVRLKSRGAIHAISESERSKQNEALL